MARVGTFIGPQSEPYGTPLSVIHPPDNDVTKSKYHPLLMALSNKLTTEQMDDLQQQILELYRTLQIGRDLPQ